MTVHTFCILMWKASQSVKVFLGICHWVFLVPSIAFNRPDLLDSFILLFYFELVLILLLVHWPSGLRALPEALRCVLSFSYSLSKLNTLFDYLFIWFLRFLSPCLAWKNLVLLEPNQESRSCWWFWFLLEQLESEDFSLKLRELKAGCEILI